MSRIVGEPDVAVKYVEEILKLTLRKIAKLSASHLSHPGIEGAVAIGKEGHKLAIGGDGRIELGTLPVGESSVSGARDRVLPEVIPLAKAPRCQASGHENRGGDCSE
ncbi:MAG TPA: hypothetical protein VK181_11655, partial [Rhizobium sp.]|nr:hypothetical protein [Rhizobium sp.]